MMGGRFAGPCVPPYVPLARAARRSSEGEPLPSERRSRRWCHRRRSPSFCMAASHPFVQSRGLVHHCIPLVEVWLKCAREFGASILGRSFPAAGLRPLIGKGLGGLGPVPGLACMLDDAPQPEGFLIGLGATIFVQQVERVPGCTGCVTQQIRLGLFLQHGEVAWQRTILMS